MRRRGLTLLAAAVVACGVVATSSAVESTIVPGLRIGKVQVGMTRAQVERILGNDAVVDFQTNVVGTTYVELGWDFSTFSVGFLRRGRTLRVAQIGTTLRGERTTRQIGVSSTFAAAARAYPEAICGGYFTSFGSARVARNVGGRRTSPAIVVAQNRKQLAFLVQPKDQARYFGPWVVSGVIVRASVPGHVDFPPDTRCPDGWRQRDRPFP